MLERTAVEACTLGPRVVIVIILHACIRAAVDGGRIGQQVIVAILYIHEA